MTRISSEERAEIRDSLQEYAERLGFTNPRDLATVYPEQTLDFLVNETFDGDKGRAASVIVELAIGRDEEAEVVGA